ncbi:1-deoxy-D-xylulose-5-phosphate synthase [Buchnera aphidicola (Neophyllaphis varicolor)]|uniref:1-deoxy-D-xylulose-5-phosphate synthase n=1 Tax=Buchnera aphidicola TaxID=9 RepID=UPI0031B87F77
MSLNILKYPTLYFANSVNKLRMLSVNNLPELCNELREYLIDIMSCSSGHFASGLGVIELTVALHYVYNTPFDHLIWDIGHQAYPHKILTNRINLIKTIGKKNGLHSFPSRTESKYDVFGVGHSSTSISAGLGLSIAAAKKNENRFTLCVIGDGAITSGMSFEAINHLGDIKSELSIILNDNQMSISKNLGAINKYLFKIHNFINLSNKNYNFAYKKFSYNFFKDLGFKCFGPYDGHNIFVLIDVFTKIKKYKGPKFLHIITKKGKGHSSAEKDPIKWHSVSKNYLNSKELVYSKNDKFPSYSSIFGDWLCEIAKNDRKLIAISPAMIEGSGMNNFSKLFPDQCFDVAIAEQHAVTFAAGLYLGGYKPVLAIYSTFLQRAYDQVIHDVAIQKIPILFAVDRGGIVGSDGQTHQGVFDLSYLRCIPGIIIMTPSDENECRQMLYTGYFYKKGPSVVRYPKGHGIGTKLEPMSSIPIGKSLIKRTGKYIAILNFGSLLSTVLLVAQNLNATVIDMRFVKPLDTFMILKLSKNHKYFVTIEEGMISGGAGSSVNEFLMYSRINISVLNIGLPDEFIPHGTQDEIKKDYKLDKNGILKQISIWLS